MARRLSIDDVRRAATDAGYRLFSTEYVNAAAPLTFVCPRGHEWISRWNVFQRGGRCKQCAAKNLGASKKRAARESWLSALSELGWRERPPGYQTAHTPVGVFCTKGHEFVISPTHVKSGQRTCPHCTGTGRMGRGQSVPPTQRALNVRAAIESEGYQWMHGKYENNQSKLELKCPQGHQWLAKWQVWTQGGRCRKCSYQSRGQAKLLGLPALRAIAKAHGGECLSTHYASVYDSYRFKCALGHEFAKAANKLQSGQWCQYCNRIESQGERMTRAVLERVFEAPFRKRRPPWLGGLELDGFNSELRIAFEFQGLQHYEFTRMHHAGPASLRALQVRDERKRKICSQRGITLIEIKYEESASHQLEEIKRVLGRIFPDKNDRLQDLNDWRYLGVYRKGPIQRIQNVAKERGGTLIDGTYYNNLTPLKFRCGKGHAFELPWVYLQRGGWCPCESKRRRRTIEDARLVAVAKGGRVVSEQIESARTRLIWECAKGHQWLATLQNVERISWCPLCAKGAR